MCVAISLSFRKYFFTFSKWVFYPKIFENFGDPCPTNTEYCHMLLLFAILVAVWYISWWFWMLRTFSRASWSWLCSFVKYLFTFLPIFSWIVCLFIAYRSSSVFWIWVLWQIHGLQISPSGLWRILSFSFDQQIFLILVKSSLLTFLSNLILFMSCLEYLCKSWKNKV